MVEVGMCVESQEDILVRLKFLSQFVWKRNICIFRCTLCVYYTLYTIVKNSD
jgi:hypothetical protein